MFLPKSCCSVYNWILLLFACCYLPPVKAQAACEYVATLIQKQGDVYAQSDQAPDWRSVTINQSICTGTTLKIQSKATLRLSNATIMRLDEGTLIKFGAKQPSFWMRLIEGAAYFITRTPKPFTIEAPYMNAAIEGTEFVIQHKPTADSVFVVEGKVRVENVAGQTLAQAGQLVEAKADQAPTLSAGVRLADHAVWTLYFPLFMQYEALNNNYQTMLQTGNYFDLLQQLRKAELNALNKSELNLLMSLDLHMESTTDRSQVLTLLAEKDPPGHAAFKLMIDLMLHQRTIEDDRILRLVKTFPHDARIWLARSYLKQAQGSLGLALESAEKAAQLTPDAPYTWLRVAELALSKDNNSKAATALNKSLEITQLPRALLLKGMLELKLLNVERAEANLTLALSADASDPLAHFAFGLMLIKKGELASGRTQLEIAVALDPQNSFLRSYLAKAYAAENRENLAFTQLALAEDLDPNDPTHDLYRALILQQQGKFGAAKQALTDSIANNDGRLLQRSVVQLESDAAVRHANLANIYLQLGLATQAIQTAQQAIQQLPSDYSGHKMLSDALSQNPRHESAAASELLQAQIRQPIHAHPMDAIRAEQDLYTLPGFSPHQLGLTEQSPMFNVLGLQGYASLSQGNLNTHKEHLALSALGHQFSSALTYLNYQTDGHSADFPRSYRVGSFYSYGQIDYKTGLLMEVRQRRDNRDTANRVDNPNITNKYDAATDTLRLGLRHQPNAQQEWLIIFNQIEDKAETNVVDVVNPPGITITGGDTSEDDITFVDAQSNWRLDHGFLSIGYNEGLLDRTQQKFSQVTGLPFPQAPTLNNTQAKIQFENAYAYYNTELANFNVTVASNLINISHPDYAIESEGLWTPKLGMTYQAAPGLSFRAAYFENVNKPRELSQTLEPTFVQGFLQRYDDPPYLHSQNIGLGTDIHFGKHWHLSADSIVRDLSWSGIDLTDAALEDLKLEEHHTTANLTWLCEKFTLRVSAILEDQTFARGSGPSNLPFSLKTQTIEHAITVFVNARLRANAGINWVRQDVTLRSPLLSQAQENFWITHLNLNYQLIRSVAELNLNIQNISDQNFDFVNTHILTSQTKDIRYIPERMAALTLSVRF